MKKVICWAMFLFLGSSAAMAQTTTVQATPTTQTTPAGASIQFEEAKFDFGTIKQGAVVEHTFNFTNNGTVPLTITNVRTTCGCTVPTWPKEAIQPGKTAAITARFSSAGKMGQQNKVITVDSNAGTTQVTLVGTVEAPASK